MCELLQFMYQGEVNVRHKDLQSFMKVAESLQIKGLTNQSSAAIRSEECNYNQNHSVHSQKSSSNNRQEPNCNLEGRPYSNESSTTDPKINYNLGKIIEIFKKNSLY